jgi:hypothetical protein
MAVPAVSPNRRVAKFPTIPEPATDVDSLHKSVLALKRSVEMLTGGDNKSMTGDKSDRNAHHVFTQPDTPTALHEGDMWLCTGASYSLSIWQGGKWLLVATLPAVP